MKRLTTITVLAALLTALPALSKAEESLSFRGALPKARIEPLAWGRDPFVPEVRLAGAISAMPEMRLKAVFYNERKPSAIINEHIVYRGSVLGGQKVIDIGRTHVILQGENGAIRLELAEIPELRNGVK